jgi:hypothetical protein
MMTMLAANLEAERPLLRGICLVIKGRQPNFDRRRPPLASAGVAAKFPRRPDSGILSESIPLFFIGRNKRGLWIVREAEGRTGGIFLFKRSALGFAKKNSAPNGCATMLLAGCFELDVENQGNPLVAWLDAALQLAAGPLQTRSHSPSAIAVAMNGNKSKASRL